MANKKHVAMLKRDVETWNQWREGNSAIKPNLSGANLSGANLGEANLSEANLSKANLIEAYLNGADFTEANLSEAYFGRANLIEANLSGANLSKANLIEAYLCDTNLIEADLSDADLSDANLMSANLRGANLSHVDFSYSDLSYSNLSYSNLSRADLSRADLSRADLSRADLSRATCSHTIWADVDLSQVKGLETVVHGGPSTIGIDTIYRSGGNIPEVFLRGAGIPDNFITYMKSLTGQAFDFYSCFISHSSKDREFVERLYADLQSNGVRCWYAPEDLKIGDRFPQSIDKSIRLHDKLLLILSENSVDSSWVQDEVLSAMEKEQGKEPWVLFPIRIDDTVMKTDVSWANKIRLSRHIGDFTQWKDHDSYKKAFDRLLRDLKSKP